MKYRFRVSKRRITAQSSAAHPRRLRLKGRQTLGLATRKTEERIRFFSLFEFAALPSASKQKRTRSTASRLLRRIFSALHRLGRAIRSCFVSVAGDLKVITSALRERAKRKQNEKSIHTLPILCGFLCATALVFSLSAGAILLRFFAPYGRSYVGLTIPDYVGRTEQEILAEQSTPHLNLTVQYENNPDIKEGHVISQIPRAGAVRRLYGKNDFCNVTLTVSRHADPYILEDLVGKNERDALLILRNQELSVSLTTVESSTVAAGCVVRTEPRAGSSLSAGDRVNLQISRGKQDTKYSIPNLVGMSETDAAYHLKAAGFEMDSVSYQASASAAGTVLSQDPPAYTHAASGSAISFVVSLGSQAPSETIPDLFGLSLTEARALASQHGLTIEKIYAVQSPAVAGTVLRQFPTHGSTIAASTRRITLYVSS